MTENQTGGTTVSRPARSPAPLLHAFRNQLFPPRKAVSLEENLHAAYRWLCRAQDMTGEGGVAAWYHLLRGWATSYPETTGYIIPTFLGYSQLFAEPEARSRAIRMADFECNVQMPSGAVRGGQMNTRAAPAVFNTGQVLFGWIAAYQATSDRRYSESAVRAAEWLRLRQDDDGAWRKDLSPLTTSTVQTYNVRTAWALALAGRVLDEPSWIEAARKNCHWALSQQQENGWFAHDTFGENETPLLHTIAYTLEGLLGVGDLLQEERFVDACERGVTPLLEILRRSETLKARYDQNWTAKGGARCPTGEAQLALVLTRLSRRNQNSFLAEAAVSLLQQVATVQDTSTTDPEIFGAIPGSTPFWSMYCPFKYVNWAAKFFMDALMLELFQFDVQQQSNQTSLAGRVQ